jgi:multiple RNA-binding domain-containing protein 1
MKKSKDEESQPAKVLSKKQQEFLGDLDEEDPELKEFLEVMRPRKAASNRTWGNDDITAAHATKHTTVTPNIPAGEDDDLYQDLSKILDDEEEEDVDMEPEVDIVDEPVASSSKDLALDSTLSDMDYLKLKMKQAEVKEVQSEPVPQKQEQMKVHPGRLAFLKEEGVVEEENLVNTYTAPTLPEKEEPVENVAEIPLFEETPSPELIAETGRIMVRNLAYSCTHEDLESHFKKFGPIAEVLKYLIKDSSSNG